MAEFNKDTPGLRNFFGQVPLFRHLNPEHPAFIRMIQSSRLEFLRRDTIIFRPGDPADRVYFVQSGEVGIFQSGTGGERLIAMQRRGSVFGEVSFLSSSLHSSLARTVFDSLVVIVPGEAFVALIEAEPALGRELVRLLSERFRGRLESSAGPRPGEICCITYPENPARSGRFCFSLARAVKQEGGRAVILTLNPRSPLIHEKERSLIEVLQRTYPFHPETADSPVVILNLEALLESGINAAEAGNLRMTLNDLLSGLRRSFSAVLIDLSPEMSLAAAILREDADVTFTIVREDRQNRVAETREGHPSGQLGLREISTGVIPKSGELAVYRGEDTDPEVNRSLRRLARKILGTTRALCLSGGGARALAQAGCLEVFAEEGLEFDGVIGSSMGAVVGAVYALGWSSEEVRRMITTHLSHTENFLDKRLPLVSFFSGRRLSQLLRRIFHDISIEDMEIPFYCTATELKSGKMILFDSGPLDFALRCSVSLPGIFPPVQWGGHTLVDGGVINNLPGNVLREKGFSRVVGINASPASDPRSSRTRMDRRAGLKGVYRFLSLPPILSIIQRSISIVNGELLRFHMSDFDCLLQPSLEGFDLFDFDQAEPILLAGREEASRRIEELRSILLNRTGG